MASPPMSKHEIEEELRKVLKISGLVEGCSNNENVLSIKDNRADKSIAFEPNNIAPTSPVEATNTFQAASTFRKDGMFSVSEIESGGTGPNVTIKLAEKTKRKKRTRKNKFPRESETQNHCETELIVNNELQNESSAVKHNFSNHEAGLETILSSRTIGNLPTMALMGFSESAIKDSSKKKTIKGNTGENVRKISMENGFQNVSNNEPLGNLETKSLSSSSSDKTEENRMNTRLNKSNAYFKDSATSKVEKAAKTLNRLNLALLDKQPPEALPQDVILTLELQHIFRLKKPSTKQPKAKFHCRLCDYHCNNLIICSRHIQSNIHFAALQKSVLITTLRQLPLPCDNQLEAIKTLLESAFAEKCLTENEIKIRYSIVEKATELCKDKLPKKCSLALFGSSVSQLGLKGCDANINLSVPTTSDFNPGSILTNVFMVMKERSELFTEVNLDVEAKLPSLHFKHVPSGVNCVISINNSGAVQTSELLRQYASLDSRVKMLCVALRHWAKICEIDRQTEGTLPPHTFDIMVIYFLQRQSPPVLPVLFDLENSKLNPKEITSNWKILNSTTVSYLWVELFRYYSLSFPISGNVISIRKLNPIPISKKNWRSRSLCVEDPFMISRNLTRNISSQNMNDFILVCFKLTFKYFGIPQLTSGPLFDSIGIPPNMTGEFFYKSPKVSDGSEINNDGLNTAQQSVQNNRKKENSECLEDDISLIEFDDDESSDSDLESRELNACVENKAESEVDKNTEANGESESNGSVQTNEVSKKNEDPKSNPSRKARQYEDLPTPPEILALIATVKKEDYVYQFLWKYFTGEKHPAIECSLCHKAHLRKNCPEEVIPPLRPLPPMSPGFLEAISIACSEILHLCSSTNQEWKSRESLLNELQTYICQFYPDAVLELFGSSCNGFGFKKSDLDICLTFKGNTNGKGINCVDIIINLAEKLKKLKGLSMVIAIPTAKVPIVKFTHTKTYLECDISLYNTLAKCNTKMLMLYSKIDPRVTALGFTMKYFAKLCDIGDASRGSLSSYAYTLMVLYFLQQRNPPVIPVLQELGDKDSDECKVMVDGWNAWYFSNLDELEKVWPYKGANTESVGELWFGLLRFYTEDFNFKEHVICIRQHKILTRFEKLWNSKCIAIEDPFDLNHNLGSGVSSKMGVYIRKAFIKGREVFGCPTPFSPMNFRSLREFLFDSRKLVEGPPPNDRGCRVCGKIGHMVRECPRKKGNAQRQNARENKGNNANQKDFPKNDASFKGMPLVLNQVRLPINPMLMNSNVEHQRLNNAYLNGKSETSGPIRAANNMMRPHMSWNQMPPPFIQPNLNQRVPQPFVGSNTILNRLPASFSHPRPAFHQPQNLRLVRPMNVQQGNAFLDQRHLSNNDRI